MFLTWVVLWVLLVQLLCELLVRVGLDAQRLANGEDLEQEGEPVLIALGNIGGEKRLVFLDEIEKRALGLKVLRGKRGVCAHP